VHAGIIEPGISVFSEWEVVVRLEERLGYVHKGIEQLMVDAPIDRAARLAGRVSGDSTVAYASLSPTRLKPRSNQGSAPRRLPAGLMAELERLANHIATSGDLQRRLLFTDASARQHSRERVLRPRACASDTGS